MTIIEEKLRYSGITKIEIYVKNLGQVGNYF